MYRGNLPRDARLNVDISSSCSKSGFYIQYTKKLEAAQMKLPRQLWSLTRRDTQINTGVSEELHVPYMAEDIIQYERKWRKHGATIEGQRLRLFAFHCHSRWRCHLGRVKLWWKDQEQPQDQEKQALINLNLHPILYMYIIHTFTHKKTHWFWTGWWRGKQSRNLICF